MADRQQAERNRHCQGLPRLLCRRLSRVQAKHPAEAQAAGSIEVELDIATCEHRVACDSYALDPVYAVYAYDPQLAKGRALARTLVLDVGLAPGPALVLALVLARLLARVLALEMDLQAQGRARRSGGACAQQVVELVPPSRAPLDE